MITRALRQSLIPRCPHNLILPPTYLLSSRARLSTNPSTVEPNGPSAAAYPPPPPPPPHSLQSLPQSINPVPTDPSRDHHQSSLSDSPSSLTLLPLLAAQPPHYIIVRIHQRPYLLTHGDSLRLPFHLHGAPPGTILRLTRASALGSRDYTFRGKPWVDEKYFVCRAQVVGVEGEPMRVKEKTKRRQRHVKTVKSKMRYTVVRCIELKVQTEAEAEADTRDRLEETKALQPKLATGQQEQSQ